MTHTHSARAPPDPTDIPCLSILSSARDEMYTVSAVSITVVSGGGPPWPWRRCCSCSIVKAQARQRGGGRSRNVPLGMSRGAVTTSSKNSNDSQQYGKEPGLETATQARQGRVADESGSQNARSVMRGGVANRKRAWWQRECCHPPRANQFNHDILSTVSDSFCQHGHAVRPSHESIS